MAKPKKVIRPTTGKSRALFPKGYEGETRRTGGKNYIYTGGQWVQLPRKEK